jgi:hypothetical protein
MFSNNIKSFIIINIYLLIIVDIILLIAIYYQIITGKHKNYRYEKALMRLKPKVLDYIENEDRLVEVQKTLKNRFIKSIVIDIMVEQSEKNNIDISKKFTKLKLDTFLIKKIKRRASIVYLRKLAFMRVKGAYYTFLKLTQSEDLDISYMSYFGLSLIKLPKGKTEIAIKKLVVSNIMGDRIIEILSRYNLNFEEWLELLEGEETTCGRVIFIKNIMIKKEIKDEINSDRIRKFLEDEVEVKIASILALCSSKNEKYINELIKIYENEEDWQVRMAVAKGLSNFKLEKVKDILLKMTKDKHWWVRYNAVKSIGTMGDEALFNLIDLSLKRK